MTPAAFWASSSSSFSRSSQVTPNPTLNTRLNHPGFCGGEFPELSPIPKPPDPNEVYELVKSVRDIPVSRFAVLCGSEKTTAVRWFTQKGKQHPKSSRVLELLSGRLKRAANPRDQADRLFEWEQMVKKIDLAREVADVTAAKDAASDVMRPPTKKPRVKAAKKVSTKTKAAVQRKRSAK
jgi:hypothetical protein